ncbi:hypothetical protein EVA_15832 [gut metagenome]|uniref:Uncharacterized protein n=1 Tax=gut metagenome TaxID=749906 RepID=J9FNP5_9ZZZZ
MAISYWFNTGELMRSSLKITVTLAVPPLCSGPYEGIQLTSLPSIKPE